MSIFLAYNWKRRHFHMPTPTASELFWVYTWPILFAEHESFICQTLCFRDKLNISYLCLYWKSPCVSSVVSFQQYFLSSGTVQCPARVLLPAIHYKAFFCMPLVYLHHGHALASFFWLFFSGWFWGEGLLLYSLRNTNVLYKYVSSIPDFLMVISFGSVKCLSIFVKSFKLLHPYIKMEETLELKVQFGL